MNLKLSLLFNNLALGCFAAVSGISYAEGNTTTATVGLVTCSLFIASSWLVAKQIENRSKQEATPEKQAVQDSKSRRPWWTF